MMKFLNIQHFLLVHNNKSLQMPWMMVGGNLSQLVYLTPHPRLWSSDCVQIMKMTFKCYISENDENTLKFRHFLHVYNNQSLEMPWMTVGGQPIPAGLSNPQPMNFEQWLAIDFVIAVNCFNNYKWICFTKYRYCLLVYKNPFLEILSFTGGGRGGQHNSAGLPYPPPPPLPFIPHHHPGHCSSEFLQIIK